MCSDSIKRRGRPCKYPKGVCKDCQVQVELTKTQCRDCWNKFMREYSKKPEIRIYLAKKRMEYYNRDKDICDFMRSITLDQN